MRQLIFSFVLITLSVPAFAMKVIPLERNNEVVRVEIEFSDIADDTQTIVELDSRPNDDSAERRHFKKVSKSKSAIYSFDVGVANDLNYHHVFWKILLSSLYHSDKGEANIRVFQGEKQLVHLDIDENSPSPRLLNTDEITDSILFYLKKI